MSGKYIHRVEKDNHYTVVNNSFINDPRLSNKAKGLFVQMLSRPDNWVFHNDEIQTWSTDGREAVANAIKELQKYGYIERVRKRGEAGKFIYETHVYEVPHTALPHTGNPLTEKPYTAKPLTENPQLINTNKTNTNKLNNTRKRAKRIYEADSDEMVLVNFFISEIRKNDSKFKEPNKQTWADVFRKLIELDQRDKSEISKLIRWVQQDAFWKSNILSPRKLREKYSALVIKMNDEQSNTAPSEYIPPKVLTIKADTGPNYD